MQDVDFSSAIQSAWLGWEHGCKIELNLCNLAFELLTVQDYCNTISSFKEIIYQVLRSRRFSAMTDSTETVRHASINLFVTANTFQACSC